MRIKNAFRNSIFSIMAQIILIVVGFFSQRVMNLRLGEELVGMNSVISNILALLSVTELGLAVAVVYHLYRAIAERDEKQIAMLMNLYRKAYYAFAAIIGVLGVILCPFIHIFLRENNFTLEYIRIVYLLWLAKTVASYLLSYRRSMLIADQKEYVVSIGTLIANGLNYVFIIVIVELYGNYIVALSMGILVECLVNIWISRYVGKKYPYLTTYYYEPMDKEVTQKVIKDIKNIFVTKLSTKLLVSTDSLIMSSFISVGLVGLYSNYTMITQSIINIVEAFSNTLQPTVGNLYIEGNHEKEHGLLRQITFLFFLFSSFAATSLFALMTPFVADVWLNEAYALDVNIIVWCVINFYMLTMGFPLAMTMGVTGLFRKERNLSVVVALVNMVLSLTLVIPCGIRGVLFGTFAAYMVQIVYRVRVLISVYMGKSCKRYVLDLIQYVGLTFVEVMAVYWIKLHIYSCDNILSFILLMFVCVVVPNGLNLIVFCRDWRFRSILEIMKRILVKGDSKSR